jgi:hypothetical protein
MTVGAGVAGGEVVEAEIDVIALGVAAVEGNSKFGCCHSESSDVDRAVKYMAVDAVDRGGIGLVRIDNVHFAFSAR